MSTCHCTAPAGSPCATCGGRSGVESTATSRLGNTIVIVKGEHRRPAAPLNRHDRRRRDALARRRGPDRGRLDPAT